MGIIDWDDWDEGLFRSVVFIGSCFFLGGKSVFEEKTWVCFLYNRGSFSEVEKVALNGYSSDFANTNV